MNQRNDYVSLGKFFCESDSEILKIASEPPKKCHVLISKVFIFWKVQSLINMNHVVDFARM